MRTAREIGERHRQTHVRFHERDAECSRFCSTKRWPHLTLSWEKTLKISSSSSMICSTNRCRTLSWKKTARTTAGTPSPAAPPSAQRWRTLPGHRTPVPHCVGNKKPRSIALYKLETAGAWVTSTRRKADTRRFGEHDGHPSSDLTR